MDNSVIVLLINDSARAIKGIYEEHGTAGTFKTMDQNIKVDDLVVVESGTRHEMTVVKVTEVDVALNYDTQKDVKWVVQAIDTVSFGALKNQEKKAIAAVQEAEQERKKAELRKSMFAHHEEKLKMLEIAKVDDADTDLTE
jgi:hypothetical protein